MAHLLARVTCYDGIMKNFPFLLIILTLFTLAACSAGGATETTPESKEVTLVATDIAYDLKRVEAVAGQPVSLTLDNQGVLEHDFSIVEIPLIGEVTTEHAEEPDDHDMSQVDEEPTVHVAAAADGQSTINFTPAAPGEYVFYCTVSGHREAGMEGVLVVK